MIHVCWGSIHVKFDGAFTAIMILQSGESKQFGDLTQTEWDSLPHKNQFSMEEKNNIIWSESAFLIEGNLKH